MGRRFLKQTSFLFCVGANHKTAELSIREELFINPEAIKKVLKQHLEKNQLEETMVISTCNRLELTAVSKKALSEAEVIEVFASLQRLARLPNPPLDQRDYRYQRPPISSADPQSSTYLLSRIRP